MECKCMGEVRYDYMVDDAYLIYNEFDGNIIIEAWRYPPVTAIGTKAEWVDRLSLAISLREDEDPRVEGEVERLINETEWNG